jgi:hypothetical protein
MITFYNILDLYKKGELYSDTPLYSKSGRLRMLSDSVSFELSNGQTLTIGKGFTWDESTIPWILQPLFPKSGLYAASALIHDALYYLTVHDKKWVEIEYAKWMIATGVNMRQVYFRYWAVSLFGRRWWIRNKNRPSRLCIKNREFIQLLKNI